MSCLGLEDEACMMCITVFGGVVPFCANFLGVGRVDLERGPWAAGKAEATNQEWVLFSEALRPYERGSAGTVRVLQAQLITHSLYQPTTGIS